MLLKVGPVDNAIYIPSEKIRHWRNMSTPDRPMVEIELEGDDGSKLVLFNEQATPVLHWLNKNCVDLTVLKDPTRPAPSE